MPARLANSVEVAPGQSVVTVILLPFSSSAIASEKLSMYALVAQYTAFNGPPGTKEPVEPTLRILPLPLTSMSTRNSFVSIVMLVIWTMIIFNSLSSGVSEKLP